MVRGASLVTRRTGGHDGHDGDGGHEGSSSPSAVVKRWVRHGSSSPSAPGSPSQGVLLLHRLHAIMTDVPPAIYAVTQANWFRRRRGSALQHNPSRRMGHDAAMTPEPGTFAKEWADAWNSRDLNRVLSYFAPDVVFRSHLAARVLPGSAGVVHGIDALRDFWAVALARSPALRFEVIDVYAGIDTVVIRFRFRHQLNELRCEVLRFRDGLIVEGEGTLLCSGSAPN